MATITKQEAIARIIPEIQAAQPYDLVEYYNELFPQKPAAKGEANQNPSAFVQKILAHIDAGLEDQEVIDLWHVIFPLSRKVWFDEEEGLLHYKDKTEPMSEWDYEDPPRLRAE